MLIVRQVQGTWKVNKEDMKCWFFKVRNLLKSFVAFQIWHVPRTMNVKAHELAEKAFEKDVCVLKISKSQPILEERLCMKRNMYYKQVLQEKG